MQEVNDMENQFMKQIFDGVTKAIGSGQSLDERITNQIQQLVMAEVGKQIPNAMPKASAQSIGSIYDPESGWQFEALTGEIMNGASSFGKPKIGRASWRERV